MNTSDFRFVTQLASIWVCRLPKDPKDLPCLAPSSGKVPAGAHKSGSRVLAERARGGAGGGNNVPLETCTNSPGRLH